MTQHFGPLVAIIKDCTNKLTEKEFTALYLSLQLGTITPNILGYTKILDLLTEGGTMHQETREIFELLYDEKFSSSR